MARQEQLKCSNSQLCASEPAGVRVDPSISLSAGLSRVGLHFSQQFQRKVMKLRWLKSLA